MSKVMDGITRFLKHLISLDPTDTMQGEKLDDDLFELHPTNYNVAAKQGAFTGCAVREFPDVNLPYDDTRSNVVGSWWSYNSHGGGGQIIAGEASYRFAGETYFAVSPVKKLMEFHLPDFFTNGGLNVRPFSIYIDRATGYGSIDSQINQFNLLPYNDANNPWLKFINEDSSTRVHLNPIGTGSSYLEFNSQGQRSFIYEEGTGLKFSSATNGFEFNGIIRSYAGPLTINGGIHSLNGITAAENIQALGSLVSNNEIQGNHLKVNLATITSNGLAFDGWSVGTNNPAFPVRGRAAANLNNMYITTNGHFDGSVWVPDDQNLPMTVISMSSGTNGKGSIQFYASNANAEPGGVKANIYSTGELVVGENIVGAEIPSSRLTIESTTGGFLPSRMTMAQRDAIASPAEALIIYQTDNTPGTYQYTRQADDSLAWQLLGTGDTGESVPLTVFDRTKIGLVPQAPAGTGTTKFLREDSTFAEIPAAAPTGDHSDWIKGLRALDSPILSITLGVPWTNYSSYGTDLYQGNLYFSIIYLAKQETVAALATYMYTAGNYTPSGANKAALYKLNTDKRYYDKVAESGDRPLMYNQAGIIGADLLTPYVAAPGIYIVAFQYNDDGNPTVRPQFMTVTMTGGDQLMRWFTSYRTITAKIGASTPPAQIDTTLSNVTDITGPIWCALLDRSIN